MVVASFAYSSPARSGVFYDTCGLVEVIGDWCAGARILLLRGFDVKAGCIGISASGRSMKSGSLG